MRPALLLVALSLACSGPGGKEPGVTRPRGSAKPGPSDAKERVFAHLAKRYDTKELDVRIEEPLPLDGTSLASAVRTTFFHDTGTNCFVTVDELWCSVGLDDGKGALEHIAKTHDLGRHPDMLSDAEWQRLVLFATHFTPYQDEGQLIMGLRELPADLKGKLEPPSVKRPSGGGVEVRFYYIIADMETGPYGLGHAEVRVKKDGTVTATYESKFEGNRSGM